MGPRSGDALLRCHLLDAISTLEYDDERREIAVLERRVARLDSPALARLAATRRAALSDVLRAVVHSSMTKAAAKPDAMSAVAVSTSPEATTLHPHVIALAVGRRLTQQWVTDEQAARRMCAVVITSLILDRING